MSQLAALQRTLAAEHAALYVYGALGAQTSQARTPQLYAAVSSAYVEHRDRRDELLTEVAGLQATPVAAAPAYALPKRIDTAAGVTAAALQLEEDTAATYAFLVASTTGRRRRFAAQGLEQAAVRKLDFGGTPEILPGLPQLR